MSRRLTEAEIEELEEIEFPSYAPGDQCIDAILEVKEYLLDHGEGSKEEMWENIVLDTSRSSAGREVCRKKGYVPKFREWWWDSIITSGLAVLQDIEPIDDTGRSWKSV